MLRKLVKADMQQMLVIEKAAHIAPWTEEAFKICFRTGYVSWGIEVDHAIIGFVIVSVQADECHILNIAIAATHQRQGWGRQLIEHALLEAKQKGAGIAYLEVRRSNSRAISLYRKMHFQLIGERKDYYTTVAGLEDALIFAKSLSSA